MRKLLRRLWLSWRWSRRRRMGPEELASRAWVRCGGVGVDYRFTYTPHGASAMSVPLGSLRLDSVTPSPVVPPYPRRMSGVQATWAALLADEAHKDAELENKLRDTFGGPTSDQSPIREDADHA